MFSSPWQLRTQGGPGLGAVRPAWTSIGFGQDVLVAARAVATVVGASPLALWSVLQRYFGRVSRDSAGCCRGCFTPLRSPLGPLAEVGARGCPAATSRWTSRPCPSPCRQPAVHPLDWGLEEVLWVSF